MRHIVFLLSAVCLMWGNTLQAADKFHGSICAKDKESAECAAAKDWMRRNHPDVLIHGRDKTMRQGVRGREHDVGKPLHSSLRACIACHVRKDKTTGQYPSLDSRDHHCAGCHQFTAVTLDCFDCHRSTPDKETITRLGLDKRGKKASDEGKVDFALMAQHTTEAIAAMLSGTASQATLAGVLFETGSATLLAGSKSVLDQAANALKNTVGNFEIAGFTDNTGDAQANINLSAQRAEAVRAYLTSQGIAVSRMQATGYGAASPIADNSSAEGRQQNRRVELKKL